MSSLLEVGGRIRRKSSHESREAVVLFDVLLVVRNKVLGQAHLPVGQELAVKGNIVDDSLKQNPNVTRSRPANEYLAQTHFNVEQVVAKVESAHVLNNDIKSIVLIVVQLDGQLGRQISVQDAD